tara:strand:- start:8094 stop:8429 length:336 start_codon:yes stop_codon:yes gene_type:complete
MNNYDPKKIVRFVFSVFEKTSADLKLKIRNDNLTQVSWFAGIARLYLENDPDMLKVMYKVKENARVMGKKKLSRAKKAGDTGNDIMKQLGITDSDKQNIFDLIEMDLEEYE